MAARSLLASALLLALGVAAVASAQTFAIDADLASSYAQGEAGEVTFSVTLDGRAEAAPVETAVVYLNVVRLEPDGSTPQAAHLIFAEASVEDDMFQQVLTGAELAAGRTSTLHFRLKDDARPARYAAVIQVFRGENTNPHRVQIEDRLAISSFSFVLGAKE